MTQLSTSNPEEKSKRPWLKQYHQARRQKTVELVKTTVDQLLKDGQTVTLEAICTRSCELDPEGKGIKKAGIIGNAEAHAYYRTHSSTYRRGLGYQRHQGRSKRMATVPLRMKIDRDTARVRQHYLLQPKTHLVERLLAVEQELGKAQQQLTALQFQMLALQEQLDKVGYETRKK